ncbi:hypothetical protein COLO4_36494 [Corchorus olitorius]|uniref:Uncharacterized protein n=1 Tax=Corchorus olitorius TaxID=93759 RepID=A0A1R3G8K5_9ROSI|nr:hypothetical protein COLO4_36494 [Corchorus olitorius]
MESGPSGGALGRDDLTSSSPTAVMLWWMCEVWLRASMSLASTCGIPFSSGGPRVAGWPLPHSPLADPMSFALSFADSPSSNSGSAISLFY